MDGWHFHWPHSPIPSHSHIHSLTAHREQRFGILFKNAATCKVQPGEPGIDQWPTGCWVTCSASWATATPNIKGIQPESGFKCFYLISSRPVQGEKNVWTLQNESCMVRQPSCGSLYSWTYSFIYGLIEHAWNQFPAGQVITNRTTQLHSTGTRSCTYWYIQM